MTPGRSGPHPGAEGPAHVGRPTRDGAVALVGGVALLAVGLVSGNNLLYLLAAPIWAMVLLSAPLGWWNVRGLEVRRGLPAELYAGREARGRILIRNPRRRLGATAIRVEDEGAGASAEIARIEPGAIAQPSVRWRFGERGLAKLTAVTVSSRWPFGFAEHTVRLPLPAELIVYPRPLPAAAPPRSWSGIGAEDEASGHGTGDFLGLRLYREGDPPRTVHWPTTARAGALYVVERAGETEVSVEVEVHGRAFHGASWEREVSRACGEVQRAMQHGRKVGLKLPKVGETPSRTLPPSGGAGWRRTLLEALATLPRCP